MDELVRWLGEQLDEDERIAREALRESGPQWVPGEQLPAPGSVNNAATGTVVAAGLGGRHLEWGLRHHIACHDPARVLREIDAKRQLLADALAEPHFRNEEDNWYSCAALTDESGEPVCLDDSRAPGLCDCGRDARVSHRLRLLAPPYTDRPGFQESWRP